MALLLTLLLYGSLAIVYGEYAYESTTCFPGFFQCNSDCHPLSSLCDGFFDCMDHSDEVACSDCNFSLKDFYGVFSPPGYPSAPPSSLPSYCRWLIDSEDSRGLVLQFSALHLSDQDTITVYENGVGELPRLLRSFDRQSNAKSVTVESSGGRVLVIYQYNTNSRNPDTESFVTYDNGFRFPSSMQRKSGSRFFNQMGSSSAASRLSGYNNYESWFPRGFNATYRVHGYCLPWDQPCGSSPGLLWEDGVEVGGGCFSDSQRCDGTWDCANGRDEANCTGCPEGHFPCARTRACYPLAERCNYQTSCQDGTDESGCRGCQPGGFHCDIERCVYEAWVCDGQADCRDGSDEKNCGYTLPRKVIAAAVIGSLICATLLVVALGCTCRLYTSRAREYSIFAPLSRVDAEFIQQQAPPSYGQLIAQGAIPPVEDFPTESPNDGTFMGNLRNLLQFLNQPPPHPAGGLHELPTRRRPPRPVRRFLRRLRRWGLLPPRAQGTQTETSENLNTGSTLASEGSDPPSAPLLPVKTPLDLPDYSFTQTEPSASPLPLYSTEDSSGLMMGMVQVVRDRVLHPLGGEEHVCVGRAERLGDHSVETESPEEEDEMLLLPLAEGFDSGSGDVGLLSC